jgi:hypothetical protein
MHIRNFIKSIIPRPILAKIRSNRARKISKMFENKSTEEIFSLIYKNNVWGKSENDLFYSGSGSRNAEITSVYIKQVSEFLKTVPTNLDVVDLGCGDFTVGSKIRPYCSKYIACDIVPELIEYNKNKYIQDDVDFRLINISKDDLPKGDIAFVRQVLQHLSNDEIKNTVFKMKKIYTFIIITEHIPKSNNFVSNINKPTGAGTRLDFNSGVVLTDNPFDLMVIEEKILCEVEEADGIIRTTCYKIR